MIQGSRKKNFPTKIFLPAQKLIYSYTFATTRRSWWYRTYTKKREQPRKEQPQAERPDPRRAERPDPRRADRRGHRPQEPRTSRSFRLFPTRARSRSRSRQACPRYGPSPLSMGRSRTRTISRTRPRRPPPGAKKLSISRSRRWKMLKRANGYGLLRRVLLFKPPGDLPKAKVLSADLCCSCWNATFLC